MSHSRKIAIVHYRVGRTDGVSLEIAKRQRLLSELGHVVKLVSGPVQQGADLVIDQLEFDSLEAQEIRDNSFAYFGVATLTPKQLLARIDTVAGQIKKALLEYCQEQAIEILLVHNIFSHGRHIAAAKALADVVNELDIPVIATNHDYYWERKDYLEPTSKVVEEYLHTYVPFRHERIQYISINSLAQQELARRQGIESQIFGDVLDFHQPAWQRDAFNSDFLEQVGVAAQDLIVLQATRIVERKAIELAIDLVHELAIRKERLVGKTLYNGKKITGDSKVVLLLAGYAEKSAEHYRSLLQQKAAGCQAQVQFITDIVGATRRESKPKRYSLWDTYAYADLVTYPSLYEGWGNQFIEAVFAKKPIVLFEYPVFQADIKKEGYTYISLGGELAGQDENNLVTVGQQVLDRAAMETMRVLTDPATNQMLENNFAVGKRYHDDDLLKHYLDNLVDRLTV